MRRKTLIILEAVCGLAITCLAGRHLAERCHAPVPQPGMVPATVNVFCLGGARPGFHVSLTRCCGLCPNPTVVDDALVLAVNQKDQALTVQVTPEQAERLAQVKPALILGGKDLFYPHARFFSWSWWSSWLR